MFLIQLLFIFFAFAANIIIKVGIVVAIITIIKSKKAKRQQPAEAQKDLDTVFMEKSREFDKLSFPNYYF